MEREFETKKKRILQELLKHRYAHRGFHRKPAVPENSMDAFKRAVLNGFGIELDIHLTKDGKLAVIHDASLKRTCGADLNIEEITLKRQKYFSRKARSHSDFDHVLKLIDGYVPLVVELKVEGGNEAELCERALRSLDRYDGLYCVESFDPRAIMWLRRNRPDIVRGQLAGALKKDGFSISSAADFMLRNLWVNFLGKPDFVA
ncbi:MAG: glycerophosphodiester phosphodiesterase family protein, partial [Anaerovoracaceae bacterium]